MFDQQLGSKTGGKVPHTTTGTVLGRVKRGEWSSNKGRRGHEGSGTNPKRKTQNERGERTTTLGIGNIMKDN